MFYELNSLCVSPKGSVKKYGITMYHTAVRLQSVVLWSAVWWGVNIGDDNERALHADYTTGVRPHATGILSDKMQSWHVG